MKPSTGVPIASLGKRRALLTLSPLGMVGLWIIVARSGLVSPLLLPPPLRVILSARDIGLGALAVHVASTTARTLFGLIGGVALGFTFGILMQLSTTAFTVLDGIVETARPVPAVALAPFFILAFGFSEVGRLVLIVCGTAIIMIVGTVSAVERVRPSIVRWGIVATTSKVQLYRRVIIPACLPELKGSIRISTALAFTLCIASEFLGATRGLGYLINVAKVTLTTSTMLLAILLLGWVSWFLDWAIRYGLRRMLWWDASSREM